MINLFKKVFFAVTFLMLFSVGIQHVSAAASIIVDSNQDNQTGSNGLCTLREAVANANGDTDTTGGDCTTGSGADTITFDATMTIQLLSNLSITSPMIIDGTSGGTIGTCTTKSLGVVLDGSLGVSVDPFLIMTAGSGTTIKGFVIQNMDHGIGISSSDNNTVQCNIFGLDQAGDTVAPIELTAISLDNSTGTLIGGLNPGDGNVIAGTGSSGIAISGSNDTEVYGNTIGLNLAGDAGFSGYQFSGIEITNSDGTIVGGSTAAHRNIISGSQSSDFSSGLNIDGLSDNTAIQGNYFGTDVTGLISIPSNNKNIEICDHVGCTGYDHGPISNITIGGANTGEGNVFGPTSSVTGRSAIAMGEFDVSDISIKGNSFGVGADGTTLLGGSRGWIASLGVVGLTIGGSNTGEGNVFAANGSQTALDVEGGSDVTISGNMIGLLADGVTTTGSFNVGGVYLEGISSGLVLGEATATGGNFIVGGATDEFLVKLSTIEGGDWVVHNNSIGVNRLGVIVPSLGTGVALIANDGGLFGGTGVDEGNTIAGFAGGGLFSVVSNTKIIGNTIHDNGSGVILGDTAIIPTTVSRSFLQNSLYDNTSGLDISYDSDENLEQDVNVGQDTNDYLDADEGPNNYINHPILISATQNGLNVDIAYMLDVPVSANPYHVEFFSNPSGLDPSGFGQGEVYEDSDEQTISSAGPQIFTATIANAVATNGITATVTDCTNIGCTTFGGTSEFSNGITGTGAGIDMATATGSQTALVDNGPYHIIKTGVHLGATIGSDTIGSVDASDKDGVTFGAVTYAPSATVTTTVTASANGYMNAWIDGDANGTFETQIFSVNNAVTTGSNTLTFTAPSSAGTYNVRFRYTDYAPTDLEPTGEALNGEVEDYVITVVVSSTRRSSVGGPVSKEYLKEHGVTLATTTPVQSSQSSGTCAPNQILTQNLKAGARNGRYHAYTKAMVTEVKILQAHMNRLGFKSGAEDGILGPITDGAIKRMQTFLGTKADGYVGPLTRALINKSCGSAGLQKS